MKSHRSYGRHKGPRGGGFSSRVYGGHSLGVGVGDAYDSDYEGKAKTVHQDFPKFQDITNGLFKVDDKTAHLLAQVSGK
jgi:hypothetical protein